MLYNNEQWIQDIDMVTRIIPEIEHLCGKSVLITGAAGLICSSIIDIIFRYNDTHNKKIKILAAGRWIEEMTVRFGDLTERDDFTFVKYDAAKIDNELELDADYIIHGASNAFPNMVLKEPVETMMSNFFGVKALLDYAQKHRTRRVLYISSSEIYGQKEDTKPYNENQYGFIDLLNPRNSYSVGKRAAETLCVSYSYEYKVESVIVRPGHIYGPTASPNDTRVSSAWTYDAANGKSIVMKSDGAQIRSYCYCLDCASAILKVLIKGENCRAYNISNPDSIISIRQMAEIIAKEADVELKYELAIENERKAFNPMNNSSLDSSELLLLGWRGCFDALTGLSHTVKIIRDRL